LITSCVLATQSTSDGGKREEGGEGGGRRTETLADRKGSSVLAMQGIWPAVDAQPLKHCHVVMLHGEGVEGACVLLNVEHRAKIRRLGHRKWLCFRHPQGEKIGTQQNTGDYHQIKKSEDR